MAAAAIIDPAGGEGLIKTLVKTLVKTFVKTLVKTLVTTCINTLVKTLVKTLAKAFPCASAATFCHSLTPAPAAAQPVAGIIDPHCNIADICALAAADAGDLCQYHLAEQPEFSMHGLLEVERTRFTPMRHALFYLNLAGVYSWVCVGASQAECTYVPGHIHYMLFELCKNAARATVNFHAKRPGELPPVSPHRAGWLPCVRSRPNRVVVDPPGPEQVKIVVADGVEDITIKVSDEGGGIPRSGVVRHSDFGTPAAARRPLTAVPYLRFGPRTEIGMIWSYLHSTAPPPGGLDAAPAQGLQARPAPPPPVPHGPRQQCQWP